jgi:hypothetical protein
MASARLIQAEKSAIQKSANSGLISLHTAEEMLAAADRRLEAVTGRSQH